MTKDTANFPYKEFWINLYRRTDTFYWEISTSELRVGKKWVLNAKNYSLDQAIEEVYKHIQEDLKNWDDLTNEMQGYYLEKFPKSVMPILIKKYLTKV